MGGVNESSNKTAKSGRPIRSRYVTSAVLSANENPEINLLIVPDPYPRIPDMRNPIFLGYSFFVVVAAGPRHVVHTRIWSVRAVIGVKLI